MNSPKINRDVNIELLRVVAMLFIVALHYLGKGGALSSAKYLSANYIFSWTIEAFCAVAVNCYVIISGYYLINSQFKLDKFILLWLQVWLYSTGIYGALIIAGLARLNIFDAAQSLFPVLTSHYWFITSYMGLYLLSPFLNIAIKSITKKQMEILLFIIIGMFSVWKSLNPIFETFDPTKGYGVIWFVCLYIIAAYLRLYWHSNVNKYWYLLVYVLISVLVFLSKITIRYYLPDVSFENLYYEYNSISILTSSIGLFLFFRELKIKNGNFCRLIVAISPLMLGVYLIHEQVVLRSILWINILHVDTYVESIMFIPISVLIIIAVFSGCTLIEAIRFKLFALFEKRKCQGGFTVNY
ncbi:MAG: acyltransferase [Candidatus Latescibacteria bacterium]|nr:acyltransferase [Candidatus Latescibacterota bacterium]